MFVEYIKLTNEKGDFMSNYDELNKRITLMSDKQWVNVIAELQDFKYDENVEYYINYRQQRQRNNRKFEFHEVNYVEETNSFNFIKFALDIETGNVVIGNVVDRLVLQDIEIISLDSQEKQDYINNFLMDY